MTPYQQHVVEWEDCRRCPLWGGRSRVVFARGKVPCDILFIGEAPGVSEDALGKPFSEGAPAGGLLEEIVLAAEQAVFTGDFEEWNETALLRKCYYNVVGCYPREAKRTDDHRPPAESIRACSPRLVQFIKIARPRLIVRVGDTAQSNIEIGHVSGLFPIPILCDITHPAAILRKHPVERGAVVQATVDRLSAAFERLVREG